MSMRRVRHRDAKRLRSGIGLTVGLDWGRAIGMCHFCKCDFLRVFRSLDSTCCLNPYVDFLRCVHECFRVVLSLHYLI